MLSQCVCMCVYVCVYVYKKLHSNEDYQQIFLKVIVLPTEKWICYKVTYNKAFCF